MSDFDSAFWSWAISIITIVGILWVIYIAMVNSRGSKEETNDVTGHVWDENLEEFNNPLPRWWLIMLYLSCIFGLVYLTLYPGLGSYKGLLNWTQIGKYEAEIAKADARYGPLFAKYLETDLGTLSRDEQALKTGARLYLNYCSVCHGADARGAQGIPNLRDDDWLYGGQAAQIEASILKGRSGVMPAWQAVLNDEGVANMTEYVLSLSGRDHSVEAAQAGKLKYSQLCFACHGADATGNQALGAPNLVDRIWLYGGSKRSIGHSIANGRSGNMPAHKEFLGEAKSHLLAAYIFSLGADLEQL